LTYRNGQLRALAHLAAHALFLAEFLAAIISRAFAIDIGWMQVSPSRCLALPGIF